MEIKFKKLNDKAVLPVKGSEYAAGMDLVATSVSRDDNGIFTYGCGLAAEIPEGHVGLLFPRSSVYKTGLSMTNCVGVIDSDYRGEIMGKFSFNFCNFNRSTYQVGDRFAQLVIVQIPSVTPVLAEELSETTRGTGGYGSTGR